MSAPKHCDDYIDDPDAPACLRAYLERARMPAHGMLVKAPFPKLFATLKRNVLAGRWKPKRVRVVMASRLGDVGITTHLALDIGYQTRVHVEDLTDFSDLP